MTLLSVSPAVALNDTQKDAITVLTMASLVSFNDSCPRYTVMKDATDAEANAARLGELFDDPEKLAFGRKIETELLRQYGEDLSRFCLAAWERLGPNGTYRRQLLKAK